MPEGEPKGFFGDEKDHEPEMVSGKGDIKNFRDMTPEEKARVVKITKERKSVVQKLEKESREKLDQLDKAA